MKRFLATLVLLSCWFCLFAQGAYSVRHKQILEAIERAPNKQLLQPIYITQSGRVVKVEKIVAGETDEQKNYPPHIYITIDRDSVMARPNHIPADGEYAWEDYWTIPKQHTAICNLFDKLNVDDPTVALNIVRYCTGEIERCVIAMDSTLFTRHTAEDFGQIFDSLDALGIEPTVYDSNRDIKDRDTAGHSFKIAINRHKTSEEIFNELANLQLDTLVGAYRIKVVSSDNNRIIHLRHTEAKSSSSNKFINPHIPEGMAKSAHPTKDSYMRNLGIIMSEVAFPTDADRLFTFYINDRIDAARIVVDAATYAKTPIEKWVRIINRLSYPKLSKEYPYPDQAQELVYQVRYSAYKGTNGVLWDYAFENYKKGYYEPGYNGPAPAPRQSTNPIVKRHSQSIVGNRKIDIRWSEDTLGVRGMYKIDVTRTPDAKSISTSPPSHKEHSLRNHIDYDRVCDIFRSIFEINPARKLAVATIRVYRSGKVQGYKTELDSVSYSKNSPEKFALFIDSLDKAKLFPAWRKIYREDGKGYGYLYHLRVANKNYKP